MFKNIDIVISDSNPNPDESINYCFGHLKEKGRKTDCRANSRAKRLPWLSSSFPYTLLVLSLSYAYIKIWNAAEPWLPIILQCIVRLYHLQRGINKNTHDLRAFLHEQKLFRKLLFIPIYRETVQLEYDKAILISVQFCPLFENYITYVYNKKRRTKALEQIPTTKKLQRHCCESIQQLLLSLQYACAYTKIITKQYTIYE